MKKIYKYSSLEVGIKIIEGNTVAITNPSDFNDINDSELYSKAFDLKNGIRTYTSFLYENELYNLMKQLYESGNLKDKKFQQHIVKRFLHRIDKHRIKGIKKGKYSPLITIEYLEFMTKLFGFTLTDDKKDLANKTFNDINNFTDNNGLINISNLIDSLHDTMRASCFSLKPDISKMWAHYGDKHKGVCIEYNESIETVHMNYVKHSKYVKFNKFVKMWLSSLLKDERLDIQQGELVGLYPFLNKSYDYKEEMEERMIVSSNDDKITKITINGKEQELYPVPKPSRVIIGAKASAEDIVRIEQICKEKEIPVSYCIKVKNYKLKIVNEKI